MDIVDSFVVALGIDPRAYNREIKNYRDDRKRLAEEDAKYNREAQASQKRLIDGVRSLRNETAGFLFMLASANGVKDFVTSIVTGDAATGRLAANLGVATERVSAWEGAIKRVGGTAADIDGALRSMSSAFQSLQLTGTTGHDADFQGLGVNAKDLQNPDDALLKISEASQRMGRPEFNARLSRIGFDQNTINLLAKGRGEVTRLLEEQRKLGVTTDEDAAAAQRLQERLAVLETAIRGKFRPAIENVVTVVGDWLMKGDNLNVVMSASIGVLGAVAIAAGLAYAPFFALAGVIGVLAANFDTSNYAMKNWKATSDGLAKIINGDIGGGLGDLWTELKKEAGDTLDDVNEWAGVPDRNGRKKRIASRDMRPSGQTVTGLLGGGGAAPGGVTPQTTGGDAAARAQRFFQANGFNSTQARGIVAAMKAENGSLDPRAFNPAGGGQGAYGIGQWRGSRLRALRARFGQHPTFEQQMQFMLEEMHGADGGGSGGAIKGAGSSGAAAKAMIDRFYRPGAGTAGDYGRAGRYLGQPVGMGARATQAAASGGGTSNTTNVGQITIYSAATDAKGLAHDMRGALAKRGLVVQANTGLQP